MRPARAEDADALYRLAEVSSHEQAASALAHEGREERMREELAGAVAGVFAGERREPRPLGERERLIALVSFAVRARSPVERDGYRREVGLVPEPEVPTRLVKVLARMLAGLDAIGVEREVAWRTVTKAGLDCVPKHVLAFRLRCHGARNRRAEDARAGPAELMAKRPCAEPGCPRFATAKGRCDLHRRACERERSTRRRGGYT